MWHSMVSQYVSESCACAKHVVEPMSKIIVVAYEEASYCVEKVFLYFTITYYSNNNNQYYKSFLLFYLLKITLRINSFLSNLFNTNSGSDFWKLFIKSKLFRTQDLLGYD